MTAEKLKVIAVAVACGLLIGGCTTGPGHLEPSRDVSCVGRAAIPLADAIAATETKLHQPVIDAEYNMEWELGCARGDPGHYDMTMYVDGELRRATVNARSGEVGPGHYESFLGRVWGLDVLSDWPEAEMLTGAPAAMGSPMTMREAVRLAEATGGKALAAHVKTRGKTTTYVIEIVRDGHVQLVSVDLETATVRD